MNIQTNRKPSIAYCRFFCGVSQIDKNRVYIHLSTAKAFIGKRFSGSIFQLSMFDPSKAPEIAAQIQETTGHRTGELAGKRTGMA